MTVSRMTSREFNQDTARAKRAAENGPVLITDRGTPSHVLLSIEDYRRLTEGGPSLLDAIAPAEAQDFEFEPPRLHGALLSVPDLI
ncbi:type II toxin-antitoxin system Phd/YefM family antitoxin [Enterovirga aerilata]|uniref:Antitoxin n=1 Tax=Enterovirga aerilata TaxID=2730920 RepID=A0A849IAU4_9HYPH|nr:type II toxin-antitoxin system Phd/YefM family antitoxin [Enterovirga sp. DB1703]NNM73375.1 type II toxin-antitoxin system Phd/YefM family antitoxin [Enterovirga sp. DB1703]